MLVAAGNWNPERPFMPLDKLLESDQLRRYITGWGRHGDVGTIAHDGREPIGATWRRFYSTDEPGYGFIAEDIAEVSIGVRDGFRGRGIGARLLGDLAAGARFDGIPALSLAVEKANPALRLYLRQGYRTIRSTDEDHVMRLDLQ
jgi:GNAT superfamily N-acetyltransferase